MKHQYMLRFCKCLQIPPVPGTLNFYDFPPVLETWVFYEIYFSMYSGLTNISSYTGTLYFYWFPHALRTLNFYDFPLVLKTFFTVFPMYWRLWGFTNFPPILGTLSFYWFHSALGTMNFYKLSPYTEDFEFPRKCRKSLKIEGFLQGTPLLKMSKIP